MRGASRVLAQQRPLLSPRRRVSDGLPRRRTAILSKPTNQQKEGCSLHPTSFMTASKRATGARPAKGHV